MPMKSYIKHSTNPGTSKLASTASRVGVWIMDLIHVVKIECRLNFSDPVIYYLTSKPYPVIAAGFINSREL